MILSVAAMAELVSVKETVVAADKEKLLSVICPVSPLSVTAVDLFVSCVDVLPLPAP